MKNVLILGATGQTGQLVVEQLFGLQGLVFITKCQEKLERC
jgi:hypothetical protein